MATRRKPTRHELQSPGRRRIAADFDGGTITSDAGILLLSQVDRHLALCRRLSDAFVDAHDPERIEHSVEDLLRQHILALAAEARHLGVSKVATSGPLVLGIVASPLFETDLHAAVPGCSSEGATQIWQLATRTGVDQR